MYSTTFARYRQANRPDPDMSVVDIVPIIPPSRTEKRGVHFSHDYHREIAWTIDYRGDNDDIPTLLYVGAGYTLVKKVFLSLFATRSCMFSGFRLYHDSYIYPRQSKAWVRIAIELRHFHSDLMSLEELGALLARRISQECLCNIQFVKLNKFLNL